MLDNSYQAVVTAALSVTCPSHSSTVSKLEIYFVLAENKSEKGSFWLSTIFPTTDVLEGGRHVFRES
jgi:hypothetical protein